MFKKWIGFIALVASATFASAQALPEKNVQVVVPYPPGGLTDNLARLYGEQLQRKWKRTVLVVNKPGGGASIGAAAVAKDPADGSNLLVGSVGMATNSLLIKNLSYDPNALAPLSLLALAPNVLYVHPALGINNVRELVEYAKKNPGRLTFATTGVGSSPHLAAELFALKAGVKIVPVPYKGTAPAIADMLGGQVDAYFDTMQSMQHVKAGKLRALAVTTEKRIASVPDLPTVEESGVAPGVISSSWFGLFVRSDVPQDVQKRLAQDVREVANEKSVQEKVATMGLIHEYKDQAEFKKFVAGEVDKWGTVIRNNNISPD
jgi:tripartite-type tricarboxylate transporter receptor subunit TctC